MLLFLNCLCNFFLALGGYFANMLVLLEIIGWLVIERIRIRDYEYILG